MASEAIQSAAPVHRFILLTDIAQSSRLAEQYGKVYLAALEQHNQRVEQAVASYGGSVYKQLGDGYLVLFETAGACLDAALELGETLGRLPPLAEAEPLTVRLALHAGALQPSGNEYFGPALNRVSRICQVCNPGQVLLSGVVAGYFSGAGAPSSGAGVPARDSSSTSAPACAESKHASTGARATEKQTGTAACLTGFQLIDLGQHHLRDLAEPEQLYQLDSERFSRHEFPPISTLDNRPNNLVRQPNHFIGRERELTELAGLLLDDTYLLSIVAPGGYGKSRLAAQLCANLLHRFEQGAFMVYLAPVRESLDVPTAIANALGFQFSGSREPEDQLCDYLRAKELLLCLDNFEHVLDSATLVAELLGAAPKLKVLITSREPLRLQGEQTYALEPLALEAGAGEHSDAARLFADRAALVKQGYALTPENAGPVRHLCEHLAGIPLAIELAAAWMDSFTLEELHDELSSRLELEARKSDLAPRHRSLTACLDWSWELLGGPQQETLMRLSTFRGGFFSEAAAAVLGMKGMKLRSTLARLADKSWLYSREIDGQTRFFLRDMLAHEYAFARLEETGRATVPGGGAGVPVSGAGGSGRDSMAGTEARPTGEEARPTEDYSLFEQAVRAHAEYYAALVEREGPRLNGGGTPDGGAAQLQALRTWRTELENINEALDTALHRSVNNWLLLFATHLQQYSEITGAFFMQRERYQQLVTAAERLSNSEFLLQARRGLGIAEWRLGRFREAGDLLERTLQLARETGDKRGEAGSLGNLALVHLSQGNYARNAELQNQALAIFREIGDKYGEALSLAGLANVHYAQGDYARSAELQHQALAIRREIGDKRGEAASLGNLANVHHAQGDYAHSAELHGQVLAIFREIGDKRGEAASLGNLANVHHVQGNYVRSAELQSQALAIRREIGDKYGEAYSLCNLANVHYAQGDYARNAELQNQALAIFREIGDKYGEALSLAGLANVHYSQGDYARSAELQHQALAIRREIGDKYGEGVSLINLAVLRCFQGNYDQSAELHCQALAICREIGDKTGIAGGSAFAATTLAALAHGQALRAAAVALHGALAQASALNYHFDPDDEKTIDAARARLDAAVADGSISAEESAQWQAEGEALSLDELAELVLAELAKLTAESGVESSQE